MHPVCSTRRDTRRLRARAQPPAPVPVPNRLGISTGLAIPNIADITNIPNVDGRSAVVVSRGKSAAAHRRPLKWGAAQTSRVAASMRARSWSTALPWI